MVLLLLPSRFQQKSSLSVICDGTLASNSVFCIEYMNEILAMMTPSQEQYNEPDVLLIRTGPGWMAAMKSQFAEMLTEITHKTPEDALEEIYGRCKKIKEY